MTEIRTGLPQLASFTSDTAGLGTAALAGQVAGQGVDLSALAARFVEMAAKLASAGAGTTGAARGEGSVSNANGAPSLPAPPDNISAEDMAMVLQNLQTKTQDAQLRTSSENLRMAKTKMEQNQAQQLEKIKEWADKTAEANAKAKSSSALGWFGKIAGFVASIVAVAVAAVATVATAGAAAPLLAIAVIGMVGAGMSLANEISKSQGGPEISIGKYLNEACTKMFISMGMDEKDAEKAGKLAGGAIGVMSGAVVFEPGMMGSMMEGIALLSGADEKQAAIVSMTFTIAATLAIAVGMAVASGGASTASTASSAGNLAGGAGRATTAASTTASTTLAATKAAGSSAETVGKVGRITQAVGQITQGSAQLSQGVLAISIAGDRKDAENTIADRKVLSAMMVKLAAQMEEDRENVKKVIDEMQAGMQVVSQMLAGAAASRTQIAGNIGGGRSMA